MYLLTRDQSGLYGLGAEAMGPPVDPTVPVTGPDVQQQIADLWDSMFSQGTPVAATPAPAGSMTSWLNVNSGKVAIGAAAFLGLMLFKGRR